MIPSEQLLAQRRATMARMGGLIRAACPKGDGFAVFIADELGGYLSNADREDVANLMQEWLGRVRSGAAASSSSGETTGARATRQAVELVAVELARIVRRSLQPGTPYIVFAFTSAVAVGWRSSSKDDHRAVIRVIEGLIALAQQRS